MSNSAPPASTAQAGLRYLVTIDRGRCEGKAACVTVCPNDVFEVRRMDDPDFEQLGFLAKLKSRAHRRQTAYAVRSNDCSGCGLCVSACPEDAVSVSGA